MNLLIEHGQLLKPYSLPWSPHGWPTLPPGWTPERTTEMRGEFLLLQSEQPDTSPFLLWQQIEAAEGKRLQAARRPWPGWVMVPHPKAALATREDRRISRAYKALFVKLNPQYEDLLAAGRRPPSGVTVNPPDGRYRLKNGNMELC
ncbi:MAG: hypothetical protein GY832_26305 [Chloroflexi bacterium]|nr:hypothetical protein [Chloroflexota bacterium]